MKTQTVIWRVFPLILFITACLLFTVSFISTSYLESVYTNKKIAELNRATLYLEEKLLLNKTEIQLDQLKSAISSFSELSKARITLIQENGTVIADTHQPITYMDNHLFRPEIQDALHDDDHVGTSIRYSNTLNKKMVYVARLSKGKLGVFIIRASIFYSEIEQVRSYFYLASLGTGMILIILMAIFAYITSKKIISPITNLTDTANKIAKGDFQVSFSKEGVGEIALLAEAMTDMAIQLEERFNLIIQEKNEKESILSNMVEGILTINKTGQLLSANKAAESLLGIRIKEHKEHRIENIFSSEELLLFIQKAQRSDVIIEADLLLNKDPEKVVEAHGSALKDSSNQRIGTLIVLNNITRLKKLERMRKDFVANVSHELRTPITLIQGFAETLKEDGIHSQDAEKFLDIINTHSKRLIRIIEDLLTLSKLEQGQDLDKKVENLYTILNTSINHCLPKAEKKNIHIVLECAKDIEIHANAPLLEQAMINLIDNAIKFSPENKQIYVQVTSSFKEWGISVKDEGAGIDAEYLPFLFQRFYRVDKARSRNLGGTGLGLSIVKHIANAHHGHVTVESEIGKGSLFWIYLPKVSV